MHGMRRAAFGSALGVAIVVLLGCPASAPRAHVSPPGGPTLARAPATSSVAPPPARDAGAPAPKPPQPPAIARSMPPNFTPGMYPRVRTGQDACDPALDTTARELAAVLASTPPDPSAPVPPVAAWDHRSPPRYLDAVDRRFTLSAAEKALLFKNGFVVPARLDLGTYARAFHEIYQSELPLYVSADAALHAVYVSSDAVVAKVELDQLAPLESSILAALHARLKADMAAFPADQAHDLDVYLTVARSLAEGHAVASALGNDAEAAPLVAQATAADAMATVTLFGRPRVVDFTQLTPRGHYASYADGALAPYFRASMWLARLEWNLVSRASRSSQPGLTPNPEETPREALDALALAELADRAGQADAVGRLEGAWGVLAGRREDVSLAELSRLRARAGIRSLAEPDAFDRLKAAIGSGYVRTARVHYMPEGSTPLPVIATLLGPRIEPDTTAATDVVTSAVGGRYILGFADVAYFLGHDRAKSYLAGDLARFPELSRQLDVARKDVTSPPPSDDMYRTWLAAIRAMSDVPRGARPSYTATTAYEDLKVDETLAAYGQLRHNYVLMAAGAYDEGGCEVPDGYVEPAPAVFAALEAYAARGAQAMRAFQEDDAAAYFDRLGRHMAALRRIAEDELANRPLTDDEKRFLSMVVEINPPTSDGPGTYNGWYFDLFQDLGDAFQSAAFVADYFTSSTQASIVYAGATEPRIGLFVVDTGGPPRVVVGPVARAFEHVAPLTRRLTDTDAAKLPSPSEPWAKSYMVPAPPEPPLTVWAAFDGETVLAKSTRWVGPITVTMVSHHRAPIVAAKLTVGAAIARGQFAPVPGAPTGDDAGSREGICVTVGELTKCNLGYSASSLALGGMEIDFEAFNQAMVATPPGSSGP